MIRVKDPKASLKFYEDVLGMDVIDSHKADDFTLYVSALLGHANAAPYTDIVMHKVTSLPTSTRRFLSADSGKPSSS